MNLSNENVVHVKKEDFEYLQFRRLLEFDNLINCYTLSVKDVDFKGDNQEVLNLSYEKICKTFGIERKSILKPYQKHTDCIRNVDNNMEEDIKKGIFKEVDGLVTNKKNINLMLSFADCTPILLYDPVNKVISNVHSGWRGTVQKIGPKAVQKMIKDYNSKPENIIACIGPCIAKCHFEVKDDVKNIFEKTFSYLGRNYDIIKKQERVGNEEQKYKIDTNLINRLILEEIGLSKDNIVESNICTVCNSSYIHSYRKNKENAGRNIALLGMK